MALEETTNQSLDGACSSSQLGVIQSYRGRTGLFGCHKEEGLGDRVIQEKTGVTRIGQGYSGVTRVIQASQ